MTSYANRLVTTVSAVASAGLGAFTISTASSSYRTFVAGDDGKTFDVSIVEGTAWEVRTGCVYTHSGTSLARGTLEASSTGSAIAFTAAAVLTVTPTAATFNSLDLQLDRAFTYITGNGVATQSLADGVTTVITTALATVVNNPKSWWASNKFTPTRAGLYIVTGSLQIQNTTSKIATSVNKNGSVVVSSSFGLAATYQLATCAGVVSLNGSTDYLELAAYVETAATTNTSAANIAFSASYLGP